MIVKCPQALSDLREWLDLRSQLSGSVGFVPTMGALHQGHRELIERARQENKWVVVSIFVNPTQFDREEDLKNYPVTWDTDLKLLSEVGIDYVLRPKAPSLYPDGYAYKVTENVFSAKLCGAHRPGHFDGVLTVVLKLLNLVKADRAYFGEKDYQQLQLVQAMTQALFIPTTIVPCPTVREPDGLALSSRNQRLSPSQRELAPQLYHWLNRKDLTCHQVTEKLVDAGFQVEYVEEMMGRRFAAAWLGSVRLIDNVEI